MTIQWSNKALTQQDSITDYIFSEFGKAAVEKFYRQLEVVETDLLSYPELGKIEPLTTHRKHQYRSIIVANRSKMVYYIQGDVIRIAAFWDIRREPKQQVKHLK